MAGIQRLLSIMARLRDPEHGCPWDQEQDFASIAPYTIEEAYEVEDAIRRGDFDALCDELGDLLLQVVYHSRMAEEAGKFAFSDVVEAICEKLVRRHPHVFGDARIATADDQTRAWEEHKAAERDAAGSGRAGALDGVPLVLPALERAQKLQRRAARVGFDGGAGEASLGGLERAVADAAVAPEDVGTKLGDFLFAAAALGGRAGVACEAALREANARFERRFRAVESALDAAGRGTRGVSREEWRALWDAAHTNEES